MLTSRCCVPSPLSLAPSPLLLFVMGGACSGRDGPEPVLPLSGAPDLTATQRTCLDSWRALLYGNTAPIRDMETKGVAPATLFYDAFYSDLQRRSPATADFFAHGGIPRKARSLMRMVGALLQLGGKKSGSPEAKAEAEELARVAETHALSHGIGPAHYEPYLASLQHALSHLLGPEGWTPDVSSAWAAQCALALGFMVPVARLADRPLVVIVGAGYAGWTLAKQLDSSNTHRILLIERKSFFLHNVGSLRAAVQAGEFADSVLLPLHRGLSHTTILPADVLQILPSGSVRVHGREQLIHSDVTVVATGSSYAFPGKIAAVRRDDVMKAYGDVAGRMREAGHIVVAGGGAVGVELAGEIASFYQEGEGLMKKKKKITLLQRAPRLVPFLPPAAHEAARAQLEQLGVEVLCNEQVQFDEEDLEELRSQVSLVLTPAAKGKLVTTHSGRQIPADLLFVCNGTAINAASYEQSFKGSMNEAKQLIVNDRLQVKNPAAAVAAAAAAAAAAVDTTAAADAAAVPAASGLVAADADASSASSTTTTTTPSAFLSNVYALGDCASVDSNLASLAGEQARWLANYLVWQVKHARAHPRAAATEPGQQQPKQAASSYQLPSDAAASPSPSSPPVSDCFAPYVPTLSPSLTLSIGPRAAVNWTGSQARVYNAAMEPLSAADTEALGTVRLKAATLYTSYWWAHVGVPYEQRGQVDWSSQQEQQSAEDAAALARSMHVSPLVARQLLMQNSAIMQRAAHVTYT